MIKGIFKGVAEEINRRRYANYSLPKRVETSSFLGEAEYESPLMNWITKKESVYTKKVPVKFVAERNSYGKWHIFPVIDGTSYKEEHSSRAKDGKLMLEFMASREWAGATENGFEGTPTELVLEQGPKKSSKHVLHVAWRIRKATEFSSKPNGSNPSTLDKK